jgi:5S rRNA maturation endonuclease (ribonuclease M5)
MNVEEFLQRLDQVRRSGKGWMARCPAHDDRTPSLSVNYIDSKILVHCQARCTTEAVCAKLGIRMNELFGPTKSNAKKKSTIAAIYEYTNEDGVLLYQKVRHEPKRFEQRRPNGKGGWIGNLNGVRRVLYRLTEVMSAQEIIVVEGEKDAETVRSFRFCGTTGGSASDNWLEEYTAILTGKDVLIIRDADEPGRRKAMIIAHAVFAKAASVRMLEMPGAKDFTEWVEKGGTREQFSTLLNYTPEWKPESVDGAAVLGRVAEYISRFVSLSRSQTTVVALWVLHSYLISVLDCTPYLAITSAEKQSGKTRLLEILETIVANPWLTGRVTAAVLSRKVDSEQPTLLLDESDAAFGGEKEYAEALRGVLNTGYRNGGKISCCVGKGAETTFKDFSTFSAKAIAGIGKLPDTVADRSIPIRLKRAARAEGGVQRFRRREIAAEAAELSSQIGNFALAIAERIKEARPQMPDELTDRQQDAAECLFGIADLAGCHWPVVARKALVELCTEGQRADESIGRMLLSDILQAFTVKDTDRLSSADLVICLVEIETSPWGEWSHGRPISPCKVARLLRPFNISPHNIRIGDRTMKGYERDDFKDAWNRYLGTSQHHSSHSSPPENATTPQDSTDVGFDSFSKRHTEDDLETTKCEIAKRNEPCGVVAVPTAPTPCGMEETL